MLIFFHYIFEVENDYCTPTYNASECHESGKGVSQPEFACKAYFCDSMYVPLV